MAMSGTVSGDQPIPGTDRLDEFVADILPAAIMRQRDTIQCPFDVGGILRSEYTTRSVVAAYQHTRVSVGQEERNVGAIEYRRVAHVPLII